MNEKRSYVVTFPDNTTHRWDGVAFVMQDGEYLTLHAGNYTLARYTPGSWKAVEMVEESPNATS